MSQQLTRFFLMISLLLIVLSSALTQSSMQRLLLLPGKYTFKNGKAIIKTVCLDENRLSPKFTANAINVLKKGKVKVWIEGIKQAMSLDNAIKEKFLKMDNIDDFEQIGILAGEKLGDRNFEVEIIKSPIIGNQKNDTKAIDDLLFDLDLVQIEKNLEESLTISFQNFVWRIRETNFDLLFKTGLLSKEVIDKLVKKNDAEGIVKVLKQIDRKKLDYINQLPDYYEYKILEKKKVDRLFKQGKASEVFGEMEQYEDIYLELSYSSLKKLLRVGLLEKKKVDELLIEKNYEQFFSMLREANVSFDFYENNIDVYQTLSLINSQNLERLKAQNDYLEIIKIMRTKETVFESFYSKLQKTGGVHKFNNHFYEKGGSWEPKIKKVELLPQNLKAQQLSFWGNLLRERQYFTEYDDGTLSLNYLFPGFVNLKDSKFSLWMTNQKEQIIDFEKEAFMENLVKRIIENIKEIPKEEPIFIAKDFLSNSRGIGTFEEAINFKMINEEVAIINPTELYNQLKTELPERKIILGGKVEFDYKYLKKKLEISPFVQGPEDLIIYKAPTRFKIERNPLLPNIISPIEANGVKVLDLDPFEIRADMEDISASKVIVVSGHNNEDMINYLNWLAKGDFLRDKYVLALTCYEKYSTPVFSKIQENSGAIKINFVNAAINENAVKKLLIEISNMTNNIKSQNEALDFLQILETSAINLSLNEPSNYLRIEFAKFLKSIEQTSVKKTNRF